MAERIARMALTLQGWTGWSREQPEPQTVLCEARRGQALGLREFGLGGKEAGTYPEAFDIRVRLMTLLADRAFFEFRRLVIPNRDGTINLMGPSVGTFLLRPGQRMQLVTPTMDGGLWLTVELQGIDERRDETLG